jgi:hypothetical protein
VPKNFYAIFENTRNTPFTYVNPTLQLSIFTLMSFDADDAIDEEASNPPR